MESKTTVAHARKCFRTAIVSGNKMGLYCVVIGCCNRQSETSGVSYFRFPQNKKKRKAWIKAVNRDNWEPAAYNRICSEHFEEGWHSDDREDVNYRPTIFKLKQRNPPADKLARDKHLVQKECPSKTYPEPVPPGSSDVSNCTPPAQYEATRPPKKRRKMLKEQHTNSHDNINNQPVDSLVETSTTTAQSRHQNETRNSSNAEPCGVDMLALAAENQTLREQLAKQVLKNEKLRRENASLRNLLCSKVSVMSASKPVMLDA